MNQIDPRDIFASNICGLDLHLLVVVNLLSQPYWITKFLVRHC